MKIAFGCDHAGWNLKKAVISHLKEQNIEILDFGTDSSESVDYPDFAEKVACAVQGGKADFGILICGTGQGMAMAANKVHGIRAAAVSDSVSASLARAHNDANIITFGGRIIGPAVAMQIVDTFLHTRFESGRHVKRVRKIMDLEKTRC